MSTLWTPGGERPVPPPGSNSGPPPPPPPPPPESDDELADVDPATLEQLAEIERQILETPIEAVIANHCYGLFQLAALHLGQSPPRLSDARLAIDALAAVVETLGDRLGESTVTLRDGLAQLRLAYVQIAGATAVTGDDPDDQIPGPEAGEPPSSQ